MHYASQATAKCQHLEDKIAQKSTKNNNHKIQVKLNKYKIKKIIKKNKIKNKNHHKNLNDNEYNKTQLNCHQNIHYNS